MLAGDPVGGGGGAVAAVAGKGERKPSDGVNVWTLSGLLVSARC